MLRRYPFYLKTTVVLLGLTLAVNALFALKEILVPLAFAILIAVLLNRLTSLFERWGISKFWSILMAIVFGFAVIAALAYFISTELASFSDQLPLFKKKFGILIEKLQHTISHEMGITLKSQNQYIAETEAGMKPLLTSGLGSVMGTLSMIFLLPVYTFLFLFYKNLIVTFLYNIFADEDAAEVQIVLTQTKKAIQQYMVGLLLEALIVASLNTVALLILGVDYAVLLGILGAILNVIPFIGGILSVALPVLIATVTKDGFQTQLWITLVYLLIQFIDNHFLVPYIVSSKVKINALISIVIVLLGGALWGFSGMFLSIPFAGVLKIIFDRIPELKAWGGLLGTDIPTVNKMPIWKNKMLRKRVPES